MTWDDYNHECQACFDRYNGMPRQEPCYQHKNQPQHHRHLDDIIRNRDYQWGRDDSPYDFSGEPSLLNRLHFLRWLWRYRKGETCH